MLRYDAPSPITVEKFLSDCKASMSEFDYREVECALYHKPTENGFLKEYQSFCVMLQNELCEARALTLEMDGESYRNTGPKSYVVSEAVRKAVADENPFRAELSLIELQWKQLDEMAIGHLFDLKGVLSYALKLSIITRKNLFTREGGNAEFNRLFAKIESDIKSV